MPMPLFQRHGTPSSILEGGAQANSQIEDLQKFRVMPDRFETGVARQLRLVGRVDRNSLAQGLEAFAAAVELEIKDGKPDPDEVAFGRKLARRKCRAQSFVTL